MRRMGLGCIALLVLVFGAAQAQAATANFQGFCTNSSSGGVLTTKCKFTVLRTPAGQTGTSCAPAFIQSTSWNFGDGTTGSSPGTIEHTYTGVIGLDVSVVVLCTDGSTAAAVHCLYNNIGVFGCIIPGGGWTP